MQTFLVLDLWLRVDSCCCGQVLSVVVLIVVDNHQINDVNCKRLKRHSIIPTPQNRSKQTMVSTTLRNTVGEECMTKALASLCRRLAYCRFS